MVVNHISLCKDHVVLKAMQCYKVSYSLGHIVRICCQFIYGAVSDMAEER
jgi:hypothetical protein